jgi:hypothetical protein
VTGTETGIDASVPYVHYYEGMLSLGPYRLPDCGYTLIDYKTPTPDFLKYQVGPYYRAPLWELVYHDCTVAQWYWGDSTNKAPEVWDQRDLFNLLYGTPPLFMLSPDVWATHKDRFVQSYQTVCPTVRRIGYDEMLTHEFLTADHTLQRTVWSSGVTIVANFGDAPQTLADGTVVPAMGSVVLTRSPTLLEVHPNERAQGPAGGPGVGAAPWQPSGLGPGGYYRWKVYEFEGGADLWIQVDAQCFSSGQNAVGDDDNLRLVIDGQIPSDVWGIMTGAPGVCQWQGENDGGSRVALEFRPSGLAAGLHTLELWADETPAIWWVRVLDLNAVE